ncbi:transglycosylase SLT domain-containing protein [Methylocystis sp. ATCC 49242]|uniref:transglycosylase SLT domain-containing protein n=1 Tax=Methylocystis sp. ATCC 49242 TaxID=622637 RepID=UPI0001F87AB2
MELLIIRLAVCGVFSFSEAFAGENVCEAEMIRASRENGVPVSVLYAVALTETGQRGALNAYAMNIAGRPSFNAGLVEALATFDGARQRGVKLIDIGCMQINHHFHGRKFHSVEEMFNPRRNVDYAAHFLKDLHASEGSWTAAVARYHAGPGNAPAQRTYVCAVIRNMVSSGFGAWTSESSAFCRR